MKGGGGCWSLWSLQHSSNRWLGQALWSVKDRHRLHNIMGSDKKDKISLNELEVVLLLAWTPRRLLRPAGPSCRESWRSRQLGPAGRSRRRWSSQRQPYF